VADIDLSDLPDRTTTHLANDVTVSHITGDLYVTDSFGNSIWHLDSSNAYAASVLVTDPRFSGVGGPLPIGLNGIAYHPVADYMIVARSFPTGALFKVTPAGTVTAVTILPPGLDISAADGIVFRNNVLGNSLLVAVANSTVYEFVSFDNWSSANLYRKGVSSYTGGTTIAIRGVEVFMTHAHFFDDTGSYEIDKIYFRRFAGIPPSPPDTTRDTSPTGEDPTDDKSSASLIGYSFLVLMAPLLASMF